MKRTKNAFGASGNSSNSNNIIIYSRAVNWLNWISPGFGGSLSALIVFGVLVANFVTCFAAVTFADGKSWDIYKKAVVSKDICETPGCIHAASSILNFMDTSVNPCDDFYRFACGSFIKNSVIPDDKSKVDVFSALNDKLEEQLRVSIEDQVKESDPRAFKLLQSYYQTCMNTGQIEKSSNKDFRDILKKFGGWPVLEGQSWDESSFDWKKLTYKLRNTGYSVDYFISLSVDVDMKNNSRRVINLDQASLGIAQEYLSIGLEEKIVQAYFNFMLDFAEIFGADLEEAKKELNASLLFEIELAKISLPSEKRRNMTALYNPLTLNDLESKYPNIPWTEYLNEILAPHAKVEKNEKVIVVVPSFLKALGELIAKTPKRVLANYALWRVADDSSSHMGEKIENARNKFEASLTGTTAKKPRWKQCIGRATDSLSIAGGALYVRRHFDESAKANAMDMIMNIRKSFQRILEQVNWMDEKTRKAALEKLDWIRPHIAYPDEFLDNAKLDGFYQYLKMYPDSYLKSQLNLRLFNTAYSFDRLRKPVNKTDWITHGQSAIVNAFYDPTENSIQFPAGILQGEFFSNDRPKYLNYGGIGYVMGHEMTHGFDDQGRQFDKEGNLAEWWETETKKKYLDRAQCIIDQYSNYLVKEVDLKINGINTQGENIADNGGIKEAYKAYNEWERSVGQQEPRLPGLQYSSQQMFWIGAANIWCSKYRPEALKSRIITDPHSPSEFRVIGPMSNMPEFAKDFDCPLGSPMNPAKKCTVW